LDAVKSGICEIVMTSAGSFPKDFPLTGIVSLPTLSFTSRTPEDMVKTYQAGAEYIASNPEVQNEYKDFHLLFPYVLDPYNLISRSQPVLSATDFKGLKVGGSGGKQEIVSAYGGAAVQQVPPQTYDNMQKGVIDAAFVTFSQVNDYHLYDLANFYSTQDFGGGFILMMMNTAAWNALGAADQAIMAQTWQDSAIESCRGSLNSVASGKDATVKAGKKITEPTAAEKAVWANEVAPAFKKWRDDALALGISAAAYDKCLASWKAIQAKTAKLLTP